MAKSLGSTVRSYGGKAVGVLAKHSNRGQSVMTFWMAMDPSSLGDLTPYGILWHPTNSMKYKVLSSKGVKTMVKSHPNLGAHRRGDAAKRTWSSQAGRSRHPLSPSFSSCFLLSPSFTLPPLLLSLLACVNSSFLSRSLIHCHSLTRTAHHVQQAWQPQPRGASNQCHALALYPDHHPRLEAVHLPRIRRDQVRDGLTNGS